MKFTFGTLLVALVGSNVANSFTLPTSKSIGAPGRIVLEMSSDVLDGDAATKEREKQKEALMGLFGSKKSRIVDPVLACPVSKEPLMIKSTGTILMNDVSSTGVPVTLESSDKKYKGRTNTYYNLLESEYDGDDEPDNKKNPLLQNLQVFIPPPLRPIIMNNDEYIPMRDLFTSPSVSFAYERGWRQGFAAAGFPGADKEFEMVQDYFRPVTADNSKPTTIVDMSCATGLFTRRLAKSNVYDRVIACDYSDSMLTEARRRIVADKDLSSSSKGRRTKLDLVRCDVGNIPMTTNSLDALHAGAAMHCWPDLDAALSEIYRVLKPGGRYFATTFLSEYFSVVQATGGDNIQQQAFQLFESTDVLQDMVIKAGFEESNVQIEVLGRACVVIRAEK